MIGQRWSGMTTTLGVLEAKRTSTHPDFAAAIVSLLKQCGAKPGDRVAINLSGSFPALGLSALSAAQVLEFRDYAFTAYYDNPRYLQRIEDLFGKEAREHIKSMNRIKLKRKLLGD